VVKFTLRRFDHQLAGRNQNTAKEDYIMASVIYFPDFIETSPGSYWTVTIAAREYVAKLSRPRPSNAGYNPPPNASCWRQFNEHDIKHLTHLGFVVIHAKLSQQV
jgi:hypothetical protein